MKVYGKTELVAKWKNIAAQLPSLITDEMKTRMVQLADYVRTNKLSGNPLNRRSGRLSRSINGNASAAGTIVTGTVGSKGVPYAHVHETGGTFDIPAHERLITVVFGKPVVPHSISVKAHEANYPQRAYLKPSLEENRAQIIAALRNKTLEVMRAT